MQRHPDCFWIGWWLMLMLAACQKDVNFASKERPNTIPELPTQVFEGFYESAPEVSSFVTCAMEELPGKGKGYWLVPNAEFTQLYDNPAGITFGDIAGTYGPYDQFAIYVRFEGILVPKTSNGYGHLGLYSGEIRVTKALETSRRWVGSTYPPGAFKGCSE